MSCQNFLDEVKSLADELSAIGKSIDDSDLILSVLNGLNSSFHSFVTTYMLIAKEKSMPFLDFHAELLNYDLMQQFHSQTIQPKVGPYALYLHKPGSKSGSRTNNNKSRFSEASKGSGTASSQFQQPLPHLPPSSPPTAPSTSRSRSPCQICKREGHQALDCFNGMNYSFQGRHPPIDLAAMVVEANTTYLNQRQWYADSDANIHVTSDIANLATSQPYEVYVDDILVTSNDRDFITSLIIALQLEFAMKDLSQLTYFLGIEATRNSSSLHLRQTRDKLSVLDLLAGLRGNDKDKDHNVQIAEDVEDVAA
ncbi:hypothetical protein F0562_032805 [Nyssa sinensis]|uniref:Reverse transcriptase Ty1/copia-type domain-containing protein n=1 Tax=Nyssa sinensis TaxID=561372 RepID=A0A5J5AST0_9ASTE|nr:hypothetical protein F0562_032805 [Nyssa sinensis]